MSSQTEAGKRWVEEQFETIAAELGADASLPDPQQEERWGPGEPVMMKYAMAYYVGDDRRVEDFRREDLDDAGAGDQSVMKKLDDQLRAILKSAKPPGKKIGF